MAIVDRTNNISVMYIRNFLAMHDNLDAECLDVGTLCTKANNPWSTYKPMDINSATYADRQVAIAGTSGFKINDRLLEYKSPTAANGYWLTDFEGYNPDARRPEDVVQSEFVLEAQDTGGVGTNYGKPINHLVIRVRLPNTDVVKKWATETAIMADTITITESISGVDVTISSVSLSSISETNYYINVPINVDLSSNLAGSTVNKTYKIWYGNADDYKKFQIPGGSTVTMAIKILNVGVNVTAGYDPLDWFPPMTIDSNPLYNGTYDSFNKRFTLTYLNIEGKTKSVPTSPTNYYRSFESKIGWSLKYKIVRNDGSEKVPLTDVPPTMYYNADGTGTPGRYYVRWSGSIVWDTTNVTGGIETGDTIQFRMIPTNYYAPI